MRCHFIRSWAVPVNISVNNLKTTMSWITTLNRFVQELSKTHISNRKRPITVEAFKVCNLVCLTWLQLFSVVWVWRNNALIADLNLFSLGIVSFTTFKELLLSFCFTSLDFLSSSDLMFWEDPGGRKTHMMNTCTCIMSKHVLSNSWWSTYEYFCPLAKVPGVAKQHWVPPPSLPLHAPTPHNSLQIPTPPLPTNSSSAAQCCPTILQWAGENGFQPLFCFQLHCYSMQNNFDETVWIVIKAPLHICLSFLSSHTVFPYSTPPHSHTPPCSHSLLSSERYDNAFTASSPSLSRNA